MALDPSELFPEVPNLYDFPSVHRDMIYDEHRVHAYQRAVERTVRKGDVVVDVGTGTGLLAFLCAKAGAKRVHAIDRAPIINSARKLAEINGCSDRILFYHGDARDIEIGEKADVMISELIGHMAFEEGMVESLFFAKDRFVKPGGQLIPQQATLDSAPVQENEIYATYIDGWRPAYGIDYSPMREQAIRACYVTEIEESELLAASKPVFSVDFQRNIKPEVRRELEYTIHRTGTMNGIALWFDAVLAPHVNLSSGPWSKTHWEQVFVPIHYPLNVNRGETIRAEITMKLRTRTDDRFSVSVNVKRENS